MLQASSQRYPLYEIPKKRLSFQLPSVKYDYIKPYIGHLLLKDLTTRDLDDYYATLLEAPAVVLPGHKDDTNTVSYSVIEKIAGLIRSALSQAIKWGYIPFNPANAATVPKGPTKKREVWTPEEAKTALSACADLNLKVCNIK